MNSASTTFAAAIASIGLLCGAAAPSRADSPATPPPLTVISPVFGQLVRFSMPANFAAVLENTRDNFYIREAVPKGETVKQWSQMITVTGARGQAEADTFSPQGLAGVIAGGFKRACPDSFVAHGLGAMKFGEHEAYAVVAGCGKAGADGHSETALIIAVKGRSDAYTIQWAERGAPESSARDIDEARWQGRLRELMPIRLCAIVPGEAAPYPSCLQQK
jgi:hypothetical protein